MRRLERDTDRPPAVAIEIDGEQVEAFPGESLATAILASGRRVFRSTQGGLPRAPFCNMGVCFDCVVTVDGVAEVRSCMVAVRPGMKVATGGVHGPR
jgi:aerobic-type carbon monoxide dehydrogenase small subunit (CoxS/CutS family)